MKLKKGYAFPILLIIFLLTTFNYAHILSVDDGQENRRGREKESGEDEKQENQPFILEKFRVLLGLDSFNTKKSNNDFLHYRSPSPSPSPSTAGAPALSRHSGNTVHRHRYHHTRPFLSRGKKEERENTGKRRTLVAVLVSLLSAAVLCGVGLLWWRGKRIKKQRRSSSKSTILMLHGTSRSKHVNSQNLVTKVTSDPDPDLFYLESITALEPIFQNSNIPPYRNRNFSLSNQEEDLENTSIESESEKIMYVNEILESVNEEIHSSDDESFHSLCNSHSSEPRLSNASVCTTFSDTSEMKCSKLVSDMLPTPPPPPPPFSKLSSPRYIILNSPGKIQAAAPPQVKSPPEKNMSLPTPMRPPPPPCPPPPLGPPYKNPAAAPPPPAGPPPKKQVSVPPQEGLPHPLVGPPHKNPAGAPPPPAGPPPPPCPLPQLTPLGKDGVPLTKLKPLHWDKVRAASHRSTVWDKLRSSSFEFDEKMIESLFGYNLQNSLKNDELKSKSPSPSKHVLEPKRLQNITILSKALNVTAEQVSEALTQGRGLCLQQLEALVKMEPTKEEEAKLESYKGEINELGSAEQFVVAMLKVPFAFSRIEAMLYRETFEDEVIHLTKSFSMLEEACKELRSSRLFLKLLQAVLKTGNRMNVGTIRGGARAFKLDTLLKLADVKGTDGKTTLLHFVVQEIVRSEGIRVSESIIGMININKKSNKEEHYRDMGLDLVSGLCTELLNVKKTATIDLDVLASSVSNLSHERTKLQTLVYKDLFKEEKSGNFVRSMREFLSHADLRLREVQEHEQRVLLHVREITEYFHGDLSKEEANPLRIFVIVRDFLGMLDHVCKELRGSKNSATPNPVAPFR